jgi:hypothetical protein
MGAPGRKVTLRGTNFAVGTPHVKFGAVAATLSGSPTHDTITAVVPTGALVGGAATSVPVKVITDGGTIISDDMFTVIPPLKIRAYTQAAYQRDTVSVLGENLNTPPISASIYDTEARVVSASATELKVRVPVVINEPPFDPDGEPVVDAITTFLGISTGAGSESMPFNVLYVYYR